MNTIEDYIGNFAISPTDYPRMSYYLKDIERALNEGKLNYSKFDDVECQAALVFYLRDRGYAYVSDRVKEIFMNKSNSYSERVFEHLCDSSIIKLPGVYVRSAFKDNKIIEYKQNQGLQKEYSITYDVDAPFKILEVDYEHKDVINHDISNSYKVKLNINIPANSQLTYDFTENVLVYTTMGIMKEEFIVNCIKNVVFDNAVGLRDMEEFYSFYEKDRAAALKIFKKSEFKEWLLRNSYTAEYLNYIEVSKFDKELSLDIFYSLGKKSVKKQPANDVEDTSEVYSEMDLVDTQVNELPKVEEQINDKPLPLLPEEQALKKKESIFTKIKDWLATLLSRLFSK